MIRIPGLQELAAYVTNQQQDQIDALTAQVQDLIAKLQPSTAALEAAQKGINASQI